MQFYTDSRITMLFKKYSFIGLGIFVILLKKLQDGKINFDTLNELVSQNNLDKNFLNNLIQDCCNNFKTKENGSLLNQNKKYIWSQELLEENQKTKNLKQKQRQNGKKGGRPNYTSKNDFVTNSINLTTEQIVRLKNKFGEEIIDKSIEILKNYLEKNKKLKKKAHYWYFRKDGWLINTAIKELEQDSKYITLN